MASILVIIPCLNEERHIARLVHQLMRRSGIFSQNNLARIVIADGGSTDHTAKIAQELALAYPSVRLMPNPKRLQSAAVNLAVDTFGDDAEFLIRLDAHADYPDDYCRALLDEARRTNAASVVVSMDTQGIGCFQRAVAAASNSRLGNGGSAHRNATGAGRVVDHGHHALMRIDAFRSVGGYDETFSHNEDAELDTRLRKAGFSIWLTAAVTLVYYPRAAPVALFKQYVHYGHGRARTLLKHRIRPRLRQLLPVAIAPAALLAPAAFACWPLAVPLAAWGVICLCYGILLGIKAKSRCIALSGIASMIMQLAWSIGFWQTLLCTFIRRFA